MTVENISWSISTKECCRPQRGLNPRPPGLQSDGASNWATEAGWPLTKPNLQRLQRNYRAMIIQICNVRPQDIVTTRSNELLVRHGIEDLDLILKERRLCWYGNVEHSNGAVKTVFHIQVEGKHGPGRPKMTGKQLTEKNCSEWKILAINAHDIASQLSERGPTDVDVAPVHAH